MICFACFVPHSPLLVPEVAGQNISKLSKTIDAYHLLEQELYASKPDTVVIISPHQIETGAVFSINLAPVLKVAFRKFGDLITDLDFQTDTGLAYEIKEAAETKLPLVLTAASEVHYGVGVPLFYLAQKLGKIQIININSAELDPKQQQMFGQEIKEHISKSKKRIAVIASGDLSHTLSKDSPKGYSPSGQQFDETLIKILAGQNSAQQILGLDTQIVKQSQQCALNSIQILLGIIGNMNISSETVSYEAPFGIGYLVQNFKIN